MAGQALLRAGIDASVVDRVCDAIARPSAHLNGRPLYKGLGELYGGRDAATPRAFLETQAKYPAGATRLTLHRLAHILDLQGTPEQSAVAAELRQMAGPVVSNGFSPAMYVEFPEDDDI